MIVVRYQTGNFGDKAKLLQYQMMQRSGGLSGEFVVRPLSGWVVEGWGSGLLLDSGTYKNVCFFFRLGTTEPSPLTEPNP